ncbi:DoxX family membrane protein [Streptomyces sp. NPDC001914]|uniref:DoxX family membrane protein n=1 Tax=Streptomyces sp. NPDC001914 TaxID=3364623 RepID=UPI00368837DC
MTSFKRSDFGLLLLRLSTGGVLAVHGAQKLFGWFGGGGISGTAVAMEAMGYKPGRASGLAAGLAETGGGVLLGLGLATPAAGAAAAGGMVGAASVLAPNGFFAQNGGFEHAAALGATAAGIAVSGPGRLSLDHLLGHSVNRDWMVPVGFGIAAAATLVVVGTRNRRVRRASAAVPESAANES